MHIYVFATVYVENIARQLSRILEGLGNTTSLDIRNITNNDIDMIVNRSDAYMFILCIQWVYSLQLKPLPKNKYFIYQLEQYDKSESSHIHNPQMNKLMEHAYHVFDYSLVNISYYNDDKHVSHLIPPIPEIICNVPKSKDIDVLFCGSLNKKRNDIFTMMKRAGINITVVKNVFGLQLQQLILRSKVVLNIRFSNSTILETCRLHEAIMSSNTRIISEAPGNNLDDISIYQDRIKFLPGNIDTLIQEIKNALRNYNETNNLSFSINIVNEKTAHSLAEVISTIRA